MKKKNKSKKIPLLFLLLAVTIILCVSFSIWYVHNEDNVYVYDYVGYQLRANYLYQLMSVSIKDGLKFLIYTIRTSDYNSLPIVVSLPVYLIFGIKRITYILSIVLCYLVPSIVLFYLYINKYWLNEYKGKTYSILFYICVLLFSGFWSATLRGLPDICGVVPFIVLLFYIKKISFLNKNKIYIPMIFGTLAYLPFILRRWYAYGVVALYFSFFLINLYDYIKSDNKLEKFKNEFINFSIAALTTLLLLLFFQLPLVKTIIMENYASSYSAFQFTLSGHVDAFFGEYGIYMLFLILLGVISIIHKKERRKEKIFVLLNIIIYVFLFTRTQGMGVHHFLGISFYMLLMAIYGIMYVLSLIKKENVRLITMIFITTLFILNFINTYVTPLKINYIYQTKNYYKFKYENYDNLKKMCSDISSLIENEYGKISSFASTNTMADSLLDVVCNDTVSNNLIYTSTVDLRDGFNYNSLFNRYVVVTDPVQADLAVDTQNVLTVPNDMILKGEYIGKSYRKVLGPYLLEDGVNAYVYEKYTNIEEDSIDKYTSIFFEKYPTWKNNYYTFEKMLLTSKITIGENDSEFKRVDKRTYFVTPGNKESKIEGRFVDGLESFKLKFYTKDIPQLDGAGIINLKIKQNKNVLYDGIVSVNNSKEIYFNKEKGENVTIEISYGELFSYDFLYFDIIEINDKEIKDEK